MDMTWRNSLEDSITALRLAVEEYRAALQLAGAGQRAVDADRIRLADGRVSAMSHTRPLIPSRPHDSAVVTIGRLYGTLILDLRDGYRQAALLYAYGAAWALRQILDGETPTLVEVLHDPAGQPIVEPRPRLDDLTLTRWTERGQFLAAERALVECERALDAGDELAERSYLADHEAADMHRAWDAASGLADAAYAYGMAAERAVQFAFNVIVRGRR